MCRVAHGEGYATLRMEMPEVDSWLLWRYGTQGLGNFPLSSDSQRVTLSTMKVKRGSEWRCLRSLAGCRGISCFESWEDVSLCVIRCVVLHTSIMGGG